MSEVKLASGLPQVRSLVPDRETLGLRDYQAFSRLAVSNSLRDEPKKAAGELMVFAAPSS